MEVLTDKEVRAVQLRLLRQFDDLCKEHGLRYSLSAGTLLGAVRHGGYIPWDDDIDVMMPRPDYEKLKRLKMPNNTLLLSPDTAKKYPYTQTFGKLCALDTCMIECPNSKKIQYHVCIDIFPIDGVPNDKEQHGRLYKRINRYVLWNYVLEVSFYNRHDETKNICMRLIWGMLWWVRQMLPKKIFARKAERIASRYQFDECEYVGKMIFGYGARERFERSDFEISTVKFEGEMFCAIKGFDQYLATVFGDYMQLPPETERVSNHDYVAYKMV